MDYLPKGNEDRQTEDGHFELRFGPKWTICRKAMKTFKLHYAFRAVFKSEMDYLPKGNEDKILMKITSS